MLEMQAELLKAAGVDADRLTPPQVYELAGRILNDEPLRQLVVPAYLVGSVLPIGARETVLRAMPESERAALRQRIGAEK